MAITILIVILIIGFSIYSAWRNSPTQKGKRGENLIYQELCRLPVGYHILNDAIFRTERGTTQIDHLVVSKYGIFAIETKNYRGVIYGDDNKQEWKQVIVTRVRYKNKWWKVYKYVTKNTFYNPVKQACGHAVELKKNIADIVDVPVIPIVVFVGSADISNVKTNRIVLYASQLNNAISSFRNVVLSEEQIYAIKERINQRNVRAIVDDSTHKKNVRNVANKVNNTINSGICPRCNGKLVYRQGRYGSYYSCSNYPNCKFTTK